MTQASDELFARCLDDLESDDPARRQAGLADLATVGDSRASTVLRALADDPDPQLAAEARRLARRLESRGLGRRVAPRPVIVPEPLQSGADIIDEAVALVRQNLGAVYASSLWGAILKLVVALAIVLMPDFLDCPARDIERPVSWLLAMALLANQMVLRPRYYALVGGALIAGCRDREAMVASHRRWTFSRWLALYVGNLPRLFGLGLPALVFMAVAGNDHPGPGSWALAGTLAALLDYVIFTELAIHVVPGGDRQRQHSIRFGLGPARQILHRTFLQFLLTTLCAYVVFAGNIYLFGYLILGDRGMLLVYAAVLLADVLLDPLWISFHVLVTRLMVRRAERGDDLASRVVVRPVRSVDGPGRPNLDPVRGLG